jgi:AAA+ superfamily predicted ATPase
LLKIKDESSKGISNLEEIIVRKLYQKSVVDKIVHTIVEE